MVLLCDEWSSDHLESKIVEWMSSSECDLFLENLLFDLKRDLSTSAIETRIRDEFETLIANDTDGENLRRILLNILYRLIRPDCKFSSVFDFMMKCLDRFGSSASILFQNFDSSALTFEPISRLEGDERFLWPFFGEYRGKSIFSLISECFRRDDQIRKLLVDNERLRSEISRLDRDLVSSRSAFEQRLSSEHRSFETEMKTAIQRFESKFDAQRESFCNEICRLEGEYSRISVEESLKFLKSSDVWQSCKSVMIVNPELKIPGILRIWNSNRCGLSLREEFFEIKRIVPTFKFSYLLQWLSLLCPDSRIEEFFAAFAIRGQILGSRKLLAVFASFSQNRQCEK